MKIWDIAHLDSKMQKLYPRSGLGSLSGLKSRCKSRPYEQTVKTVRVWPTKKLEYDATKNRMDAPGEMRIDLRDGSRIVAKTDSVYELRAELATWRNLRDARTVFEGSEKPLQPVDMVLLAQREKKKETFNGINFEV